MAPLALRNKTMTVCSIHTYRLGFCNSEKPSYATITRKYTTGVGIFNARPRLKRADQFSPNENITTCRHSRRARSVFYEIPRRIAQRDRVKMRQSKRKENSRLLKRNSSFYDIFCTSVATKLHDGRNRTRNRYARITRRNRKLTNYDVFQSFGNESGGKRLTLLDQPENEVVLFLGFNRHEVHAIFPADVSRFQPIDFGRFVLLRVAAEEVIAPLVRELFRSLKRKPRG